MDSRQILMLYFTLTQKISGVKAKINLLKTLKLKVVMTIIYLVPSHF